MRLASICLPLVFVTCLAAAEQSEAEKAAAIVEASKRDYAACLHAATAYADRLDVLHAAVADGNSEGADALAAYSDKTRLNRVIGVVHLVIDAYQQDYNHAPDVRDAELKGLAECERRLVAIRDEDQIKSPLPAARDFKPEDAIPNEAARRIMAKPHPIRAKPCAPEQADAAAELLRDLSARIARGDYAGVIANDLSLTPIEQRQQAAELEQELRRDAAAVRSAVPLMLDNQGHWYVTTGDAIVCLVPDPPAGDAKVFGIMAEVVDGRAKLFGWVRDQDEYRTRLAGEKLADEARATAPK